MTGDRFSSEFLEKRFHISDFRKVSLQTFIDRVSRHQVLASAPAFRQFLSVDQMVRMNLSKALVDSKRDSTVFDNLTEGFINAFSKVWKD